MNSKRRFAGIGLVEVLATVAILGILLALAAPSFADFLDRRRVETTAAELASDIGFAKALIANSTVDINVRFGATCYAVMYFSGVTNTCPCDGSSSKFICTSAAYKNSIAKKITTENSITLVTNNSIKGNGDILAVTTMETGPQPAAINVVSSRKNELQVKVSATGRPTICTTDKKFPAYPDC